MARLVTLILLLLLLSCSEEKKPEYIVIEKEKIPEQTVEVKIAFRRNFPPAKRVLDYTDVNPALANEILTSLKADGEIIKVVPKLTPAILLVDKKEYKLYPHTIMDLAANKQYHFEDIYKKLYADWMKYMTKEDYSNEVRQ